VDVIEFAYVTFGFAILSIAMIAYTFGFNQFLMYQFSREKETLLEDLFLKLFKIYFLHVVIVSLSFMVFLQFYEKGYMLYGFIFLCISLIFSFRDYLNIPNIIEKNYQKIIVSNILFSIPIYITIILILLFKTVSIKYLLILLIFLLVASLLSYDMKDKYGLLFQKTVNQNNFQQYKKTFSFGISVFLFTIYYQLSNILLPLLENEKIVATFGVIFIYLGIIYILLNIVFNQIILPNLYRIYKENKVLYFNTLNTYKMIFTLCGLFLFFFTLLISYFSNLSMLNFINTKYPFLFEGIRYVSLGILARYVATIYSGNMNVIGQISRKIKIQIFVTIISFILTYFLIITYSLIGACIAYSGTETILLIGYLLFQGESNVKKT
jgi:O-antigen/teichoic acid export membrane protein